MTFEELLMVIDPNGDDGEILELEFRGNDEFNRVRSDCIEILEPLFEYQVNCIGINDNSEQRIWLDPPNADRKTEPQYEAEEVAKDINRKVDMGKKEWNARHIEDEPQTERSSK